MQAIILAGGEGIKLRPLTFSWPKPLLPLINKPILDYVLFILISGGIDNVIITTDFKADALEQYIAENKFELPIKVVRIQDYHGTAQILKFIEPQLEEDFLVVPGDCIYDMTLKKVIEEWRYFNADVGLILRKEKDVLGKGGLLLRNYKLTQVVPLTDLNKKDVFSDALIYFFKKSVLNLVPPNEHFDIHLDLIQAALDKKLEICPIQAPNFWAVIGRIHPYIAANFWLLQNIGNTRYIGANSHVDPSVRLIQPYFIDEGCQIEAGAELGPNVILGKNAKVGSKTKIDNSLIHTNVKIGANSRIKHSIISHNCILGDEVQIGELSIVAMDCVVADNAKLNPGARIGPKVKIEKGRTVKDFVFSFGQDAQKIRERWSKTVLNKLNPIQMDICLNLQQSGEQTKEGLIESLACDEYEVTKSLNDLVYNQIIVTYGSSPVIYSLVEDLIWER